MSSGLIGSRRSALSKAYLPRVIWCAKAAKDSAMMLRRLINSRGKTGDHDSLHI